MKQTKNLYLYTSVRIQRNFKCILTDIVRKLILWSDSYINCFKS